MPRALITGITGQDGSYLAESHWIKDTMSSEWCEGAAQSITNAQPIQTYSIRQRRSLRPDTNDAVKEHNPDGVYNLAAQSFVQTSFGQPVLTGETTALSVTRILDAIRNVDPSTRFIKQALANVGKVAEVPQMRRPLSAKKPL